MTFRTRLLLIFTLALFRKEFNRHCAAIAAGISPLGEWRFENLSVEAPRP